MHKAYVLASGYGRKMWPYTDKWQKCCLKIGNIPSIVRTIRNLKELGISEITVAAGCMASQVRYFLGNIEGINIVEEQSPKGTAYSLLNCMESGVHEDFLVLYGDSILDKASIKNLMDQYDKLGICVLTEKLQGDIRANDHMCAQVEDGKVKAIFGHPRSHYVNRRLAGAFALNKEIVSFLKANPGRMLNVPVGGMPPEDNMLEQSLQMMIENNISIYSEDISKYCIDLDRPWNILDANDEIIIETFKEMSFNNIDRESYIDDSADIRGKVSLGKGSRIGKNVIIKGDVWIGDNTLIDCGAILEGNNIIGDGCSISDYCKISANTTIGDKNRIGFGAEVQGVTFDGVSIVHNAEVYGVVGSHTDIAAGCMMGVLRFDDEICRQKLGKRLEVAGRYGNAIFLGDYTRTGISNIFYPGVKVGSNCAIGPGAIVDKDINSNTLVLVEQNKIYHDWGTERYNW
jgi:UDP-N-acetylglucosamine diphosphorylase / glucose-1-phosphate thymidylyltransferase / UDP-N-acetylgalactosamine diphosphorylase / glucosamine-1-phosphate N-acetyltransferase / galactosamine-1-phosphate N-acetyltransferase